MNFKNERLLNDMINGKLNGIHYNQKNKIGYVSEILFLNHFDNIQEYMDYYYNNILSKDKLNEYCYKIYTDVGKQYQVLSSTILSYLENLIFYRSWDGIIEKENNIIQWLNNKGYKSIKSNNSKRILEADRLYAVDLFTINNHLFYGTQCKPITFKGIHYIKDYIINLNKNILFLETYKEFSGMIYVFYNKNVYTMELYTLQQLYDKVNDLTRRI